MVAVVRHLNAEAFGCLDEIKAVFDRDRAAIDFKCWHGFLKTSNE